MSLARFLAFLTHPSSFTLSPFFDIFIIVSLAFFNSIIAGLLTAFRDIHDSYKVLLFLNLDRACRSRSGITIINFAPSCDEPHRESCASIFFSFFFHSKDIDI